MLYWLRHLDTTFRVAAIFAGGISKQNCSKIVIKPINEVLRWNKHTLFVQRKTKLPEVITSQRDLVKNKPRKGFLFGFMFGVIFRTYVGLNTEIC